MKNVWDWIKHLWVLLRENLGPLMVLFLALKYLLGVAMLLIILRILIPGMLGTLVCVGVFGVIAYLSWRRYNNPKWHS
jgi:hypothetical protein